MFTNKSAAIKRQIVYDESIMSAKIKGTRCWTTKQVTDLSIFDTEMPVPLSSFYAENIELLFNINW
jgi:hypothetical protein